MEGSHIDAPVPAHVAIIMDGNGRWARERGLERTMGHQAGARNIRRVVEATAALGVESLTLYVFSTENWRRPLPEVTALMGLLKRFIRRDISHLKEQGVRVRILGRRAGLSADVLQVLDHAVQETQAGSRLNLNLAINYGGRAELVDAARGLVRAVDEGAVSLDQVDESMIARYLCTSGLPDPEIVIRTGGDQRLSNFMIWQTVGAYFWSTPRYWPDFGQADLEDAIQAWRDDRSYDDDT